MNADLAPGHRRYRLVGAGPALHVFERLTGRLARWLSADSADAVRFMRRTVRRSPPDRAADLAHRLDLWQRRIARTRIAILLRRWTIAAAILAALLALLHNRAPAVPGWVIGVLPGMALLGGLALLAPRSLGPERTARLLDLRLGLKDQLSTALEVARGTAPTNGGPLNRRLEVRAADLADETYDAWIVQPAHAGREWTVLVIAAAGLSALLIVPAARPPVAAPSRLRAAALATPASSAAAAVPTLAPQTNLPVHMSVAVVNRRVPTREPSVQTGGRGGSGTRPLSPQRAGAVRSSGAPRTGAAGPRGSAGPGAGQSSRGNMPPPAARHAPTKTTGRANFPPGLPLQPRSRQASIPERPAQGPGAPVGNQTAPGKQGAAGGRAAQGQAGRHGAGTNSATSRSPAPASGPRAANGQGRQRTPGSLYGGYLPSPSQLPKPGLITGKGSFSGTHLPGGSSVGRTRGAQGSRLAARGTLPPAQSHQLTLRSAYGGALATQGQRGPTQPDRNASPAGAGALAGRSTQDANAPADYVPPDANAVPPADRDVLTRYFAP